MLNVAQVYALILTAGACQVDMPSVGVGAVGAVWSDIRQTLPAFDYDFFEDDGKGHSGVGYVYERTDSLGGVHVLEILVGKDGRVVAISVSYQPFAALPSWLVRVRDSFNPAGK